MIPAPSRRTAVAVLAISLLAVTITATGGSVISTDYDRISDDIVAEPHDGPNGAYAYLTEDGDDELVIDLTADNDAVEGDGVNADAITGINDVFSLTYTGEKHAHVWLEHDSENVTFYRDGADANPIEGKANNVTLTANESVAVGFTVDSRDLETIDPLIDEMEIHAKVPDGEKDKDDADERDDTDDADHTPGTGAPPATPTKPCPAGPTVTVEEATKTTRTVALSDVDACQTASIDLLGLEVGSAVTLEELAVTPAKSDDVTLEATATEASKSKPVTDADETPIGAVTVDGPDNAVETVEYRFAVDRSWLEREGIDPDTVSLYGHDGDDWTALEVERTGERADALEYAASDDGFARYVVAAELPDQDGDQKHADRSSDDTEKPPGADGDDPAATDGSDPAATDDGDDTDASGSVAIVGLALAVTLGLLVARLARGDD